jgi:hypothetical protein
LVKDVTIEEKDAKPEDKQTVKQYIDKALSEADGIWSSLKKYVQADPKFKDKPDEEKIEIFQKNHKEFYQEFPIVCRYMICMGQYKKKAFQRYLKKVKSLIVPEPGDRAKNYMEDQWVRRQADYIRYLWEEYQVKKINMKEAQAVWKQAYEALTKEFSEFRDMHKTIEDRLKKETNVNNAQAARELLNRLSSGSQSLPEQDTNGLIEALRIKVLIQRKKKLLQSIESTVKMIDGRPSQTGKRKPDERDKMNYNPGESRRANLE